MGICAVNEVIDCIARVASKIADLERRGQVGQTA
jgi:hypothetical protein